MIATLTLNASIDKRYRLDQSFELGEVSRVAEVGDTAGGKGLNASRAVKAAGAELVATGFVGGYNGEKLCALLSEDHIEERFVRTQSETRCCINVLEPSGRSTELLEPGRPVSADEIKELKQLLRKLASGVSVCTMSGSAPAGCPATIYAELIEICREHSVPVILDTSGELLLEGFKAAPYMVKPNRDEIAYILGKRPESKDEVIEAARTIRHNYKIKEVVVSLGGDGAVLSCDEGEFIGRAPQIEVVNPVGSGDTLVGAAAVALERGLSAPERLRFAMSCASANCLTASTGSFKQEDADRLLQQTEIHKL